MANILRSCFFNTMVACFTTVAFTTVTLAPVSLMAVDLKSINFGVKIEKLRASLKRCIDNGETNKIVSHMFNFKNEVEQYTGKRIDINRQIDQAQREARAKGQRIDDRYIRQIKKDFIKEGNKQKHRGLWLSLCDELDIPYSTFESDTHFDMMMAANGNEEKREDVPITVMVGITVTLCGLFLIFVPLPGCQTAGSWLLNTGVGIIGSDALAKWDAYDQQQRKKSIISM